VVSNLRPSLFRDVTRHRLVVNERRFGTVLFSSVKQSRKKRLVNTVHYWLIILPYSGWLISQIESALLSANNEVERIWKKAVMVQRDVGLLSWHLPEGGAEIHLGPPEYEAGLPIGVPVPGWHSAKALNCLEDEITSQNTCINRISIDPWI
jgi:hypothetical protein